MLFTIFVLTLTIISHVTALPTLSYVRNVTGLLPASPSTEYKNSLVLLLE